MILANPMVAMECIRVFMVSTQAKSCLNAILQSPLSVSVLHVASQMMLLPNIPVDFFESFMKRTYFRLVDMDPGRKQYHLVQCFCFYLSGMFKNHLGSQEVCE